MWFCIHCLLSESLCLCKHDSEALPLNSFIFSNSSWGPIYQIFLVLEMSPLSLWPFVETKGSTLVTGKCHKLKVRDWRIQRTTALYCVYWSISQEHVNLIPHHSRFLFLSFTSGRVAALNMLKKPTKIESVPFFWTVLLGKSIRYTGKGFTEKMAALNKNI